MQTLCQSKRPKEAVQVFKGKEGYFPIMSASEIHNTQVGNCIINNISNSNYDHFVNIRAITFLHVGV